jgi:hypothetical protein
VRCERVFQTCSVFKAWQKELPCVAARLRRKADRTSLARWWLVVGLGARSLAGADTGSVRCNAATALNAGRVGSLAEAAVMDCSKRLTPGALQMPARTSIVDRHAARCTQARGQMG